MFHMKQFKLSKILFFIFLLILPFQTRILYFPSEAYIFDLFRGKRIHTTELLDSPLEEGRHICLKELSRIYVGVLNDYDLITSKLFRGTAVDFEDCLSLIKARRKEIDIKTLATRFCETAKYEIAEERVLKNFESFQRLLRKEGLYGK